MKSVRLDYPLDLLCRFFAVSRSGYYAALERPASQRARDDERLKVTAQALWRAARNKRPAPGLILHSDRGSQYCAEDYQKLTKQFGMLPSMSRKRNCYDNAPMESFWGSLKNELIFHQRYATRADAESAIREYIEIFHNRQRRHSRLGYISPARFADNFSKHELAA